ncbi:NAD-dependent epimerase/dehydratase family protein [Flavobacteriaceae bacterium]|nr:NAD-dependent epimerase/dehydratase family protein [Flavobacteriaceae bacterium]
MKKVILLTGASGFLGSHIANMLVNTGIELVALKRKNSDCYRCNLFTKKINWIDIDPEKSWKEKVINLSPTHIIHCAWIGVEVCERDDIKIQTENISFLADLLEISKTINLTQFIGLGSQAEYGILKAKVSEHNIVNPVSAYGATKVASQQILKTFCNSNKIKWIWLRLFSFIGEHENNNWLIPSLIDKIIKSEVMDMTPGEQKYSYMFVNDFALIILKIINSNVVPGIYNVSGDEVISLKELVNLIGEKLRLSPKINWGVLPYRISQSMHIEGNTYELRKQIGDYKLTSISDAIERVVTHHKN